MLWVSDGKTCLPCAWHPEHSCSSTTNVSRKRLSKKRTQELKSLGDLTANIRWKRMSNNNGCKWEKVAGSCRGCALCRQRSSSKLQKSAGSTSKCWALSDAISDQRSKRSESHLSDQGWDLGRFRYFRCNTMQHGATKSDCPFVFTCNYIQLLT